MGQLVIEVPQNISLKFTVESSVADEILRLVEKPEPLRPRRPLKAISSITSAGAISVSVLVTAL